MDIMIALGDGPKNPTRLMYTTNLSWAPLQECLKTLIGQGAINESEQSSNRKSYSLTQKGTSLINSYKEFASELTPLSNFNDGSQGHGDIAMIY